MDLGLGVKPHARDDFRMKDQPIIPTIGILSLTCLRFSLMHQAIPVKTNNPAMLWMIMVSPFLKNNTEKKDPYRQDCHFVFLLKIADRAAG